MIQRRIDLAGLVQVHDRRTVDERIKIDTVEFDIGGILVHRIAFDNQLVVWDPFLQLERAAGNDVSRLRPSGVSILFNRFPGNRLEELMSCLLYTSDAADERSSVD